MHDQTGRGSGRSMLVGVGAAALVLALCLLGLGLTGAARASATKVVPSHIVVETFMATDSFGGCRTVASLQFGDAPGAVNYSLSYTDSGTTRGTTAPPFDDSRAASGTHRIGIAGSSYAPTNGVCDGGADEAYYTARFQGPTSATANYPSGTYTISGHVRRADGSPSAGTSVTISGGSGAVTDANGAYSAVAGQGAHDVSAGAGFCVDGKPSCTTSTTVSGPSDQVVDFTELDHPSMSISNASVGRPAAGSTATATFTVSLTRAVSQPVSVDYATSDLTATSPLDYQAATGTLSFGPGETAKQVAITVNHGRGGAGRFSVDLSNPQGADISSGHGVATIRALTVTVNSTGDRAQSDSAPATSCDTGQTVNGQPECTLRAAIQAINAGATPDTITFSIPGQTNPVIAPASALPVVTQPVSIDATTQGSWVVLSGKSAGAVDGLEVDGAGSTVQGFVIDGFASGAGIVAGGSAGAQAITGNRIGTDVSGTAAVPNAVGIRLLAPDVRVGGSTETSASACTGACNLIAGNATAQITNMTPSAGVGPFIATTIQGNWIGLSVSGTGLNAPGPASDGVELRAGPPTHFGAGDAVTIGGPSSAPGVAPGNRVAANGYGIVVAASATGASFAGTASIAGNTVGLNAGATGAAGHGHTGIAVYWESTTPLVVGGTAAGQRNVVGGWSRGIEKDGSDVIGNRIGTDPSGTAAIPNDIGVYGSNGDVRDNLISGNHVGVGTGGAGEVLGTGNVIGLAADGEHALPNDIGLGGDSMVGINIAHLATIGGCSRLPCNVISGNRVAGIKLDASFTGLVMYGTYVGTDITGTRAIPNGVGIESRNGSLDLFDVGGATGVARGGLCAYPCNVIAGNTGPGLELTSTATEHRGVGRIAGNLIGIGADGRPLPNGGAAQITVGGSPARDGDAIAIGGTTAQGNVIASQHGPAIAIGGDGLAYPAVMIQGDVFRRLDASAPITRPARSVNPPILTGYQASGGTVTVTGSTHITADPGLAPEQVEIYAGASCANGGDLVPVGVGAAAKLSGNFSIGVPATALAGRPFLLALRTDQHRSTSHFSVCAAGPKLARASRAVSLNGTEIPVDSNHGWAPGDYAQIDTPGGPVVREVARLHSLILAAPVGRRVPSGTYIFSVPAPRADRQAPKVTVSGLRSFGRGARATVRFRCQDLPRPTRRVGNVGVAVCPRPLRLDTGRAGPHIARVRAWDNNGNVRTVLIRYRVRAR